MRWTWVPLVGLVAACYRPSVDESACHVRCAYDPLTQAVGGCPAGLLCDLGTCKANLGDVCMIDAGVDDAPLGDGARDMTIVDVPIDAPQTNCYGSGLITICLATPPVAPYTPGSTIINTSNAMHCTPWSHTPSSANEVCLIAASSVTIGPGVNLQVRGARPLVIVSESEITVAGTIDASGSFPIPAAGAPNWQCTAGTGPSDLGGGAGGSFVTLGGAGGNTLAGSTGGTPGGVDLAVGEVRAGCGGQSGSSTTGPLGVGGGAGGGAIYLIAKTQITLNGAALIDASGEPGKGGLVSTGGGAGGSGGMIGLDAPSIVMQSSAKLLANGGGGGCGGTTASGGGNGQSVTTPHLAAGGCVSAGGAGSGGAGGYDLVDAVAGGPVVSVANNGGGGGGGGAGVIVVYPDSQRAALGSKPSPLPTSPLP